MAENNSREMVGVPRWLIERAMESCRCCNDLEAFNWLLSLLDPRAFPKTAKKVLSGEADHG